MTKSTDDYVGHLLYFYLNEATFTTYIKLYTNVRVGFLCNHALSEPIPQSVISFKITILRPKIAGPPMYCL
jgi:hypothetical protein